MATHFQLTLGQVLTAKVVELISNNVLVVDIDGKLFRVVNQTGRQWKAHDAIRLRVSAVNPPEFQIQSRNRGFDRFA